jgi:NAD(P)-dependent dehydrogenase (short-subunit alcohol dehydrogenase family)
MQTLPTRTAIVTGSNRGVGLGVAVALGKLDFNVVIASRCIENIKEAANIIGGTNIYPISVDITDPLSVSNFFEKINIINGRVDVLINNAGIHSEGNAGFMEVSEEILIDTLNTNLMGAWRMCKGAAPFMINQKYGRILNITSGWSSLTEMDSNAAAYRISKTALNALTRIVSSELEPLGNIKVNCACPGWVKTRLGGEDAPLNIHEAATHLVRLATLPDDGPSGKFFRHGIELPW